MLRVVIGFCVLAAAGTARAAFALYRAPFEHHAAPEDIITS